MAKKPQKSLTNAFDKARAKASYFEDFSDAGEDEIFVATNPWSGAEVILNGLEYTIYNFCTEWYKRYSSRKETEVPVQTYDNMRYYLLHLNSNAYMELLD